MPAASARLRPCSLLRSCSVDSVQRLGALGDPLLQLLVELLQLAGLAEQFGENPHLGAQQFRHHRHGKIIHRARLIAAQIIGFRQVNGGDEDDRGLLEARMLADHLGQLEAVQLRHADIDQDDRDIGLEQIGQRLLGRGGRDQIFAQLLQHHLIAEQLAGLIIHQQDIDGILVLPRLRSPVQPHAQRRQQAARC